MSMYREVVTEKKIMYNDTSGAGGALMKIKDKLMNVSR